MNKVLLEFVDNQGRKWFGAATVTPLRLADDEPGADEDTTLIEGRGRYDFRVQKLTVVLGAEHL